MGRFTFYDRVWYWDVAHPDNLARPGCWLGVSHRQGGALCYWILAQSGQVLSRTTVQHVPLTDLQHPTTISRFQSFDEEVRKLLDDPNHYIDTQPDMFYVEDAEPSDHTISIDPEDAPLLDVDEIEDYDEYLGAELTLAIDSNSALQGWLSNI
eukprot:Nitzschia sp. Nitz4//scaffold67_size101165//3194//3652//NITZ4_004519-RA/size101165-processed-gene-0.55-mRNA-1//-1//CDS//3329556444//3744//frame0